MLSLLIGRDLGVIGGSTFSLWLGNRQVNCAIGLVKAGLAYNPAANDNALGFAMRLLIPIRSILRTKLCNENSPVAV